MIELLTPSAKGEPTSPGAKSAGGAPGGIDFAALFGSVVPATPEAASAVPITNGTTPTATPGPTIPGLVLSDAQPSDPSDVKGGTIAPTMTLPVATPVQAIPPAVLPAAIAPTILTPALATPAADKLPSVATPMADTPLAVATPDPDKPLVEPPAIPAAAADPSIDPTEPAKAPPPVEDDDAATLGSPVALPPQLAAKLGAIKPHAPVVVEDEAVTLPTVPANFVAQKAPRLQPAAANDAQDDEPAAEEPAVVMPQPLAIVAQVPVQAPVAPEVAVAVAASVTLRRVAPGPVAKLAERPEAAVKADDGTALFADPQAPVDSTPATSGTLSDSAIAALPPKAADQLVVQAPVLNSAAPVGAPVAVPIVDTSAIPVSTQRSVALDNLMVAGAGDSGWLDRLATDITTLASGDAREAHMRLNPHSLGDVSIRLDMDGQNTRVHFTVETQAAATLISDGTQKLTSLVQANGLKLDGATVDLSQRRDDGRPSDQGQQRQADVPATTLRARSETARLIERTRIAVATERFA